MFTRIENTSSANTDPHALSITSTGRISLNKHLVEEYGIQKNAAVNLYWDEKEKKVAIVFTQKGTPGSFSVIFVPNGLAAYITATRFFRSSQLDPEACVGDYRFDVTEAKKLGINSGTGDAFVIDLSRQRNSARG
jgi:hypothetical protein